MKKAIIYTDGSHSFFTHMAGWGAVVIIGNKKKELCGSRQNTTSERMEMTSVIEASKYAISEECDEISIYSDSKNTVKTINDWIDFWKKAGWKRYTGEDIKNLDLVMKIDEIKNKVKLKAFWVKGHNGNKYNEIADRLSRSYDKDETKNIINNKPMRVQAWLKKI